MTSHLPLVTSFMKRDRIKVFKSQKKSKMYHMISYYILVYQIKVLLNTYCHFKFIRMLLMKFLYFL